MYGDLESPTDLFTEETPYVPSSPYSASKASSVHLVGAWLRIYGLPTVITNCSNNYGQYHFPEKSIPLIILKALEGCKLIIQFNYFVKYLLGNDFFNVVGNLSPA